MRVALLLFAQCRTAAGRSELTFDLPEGAGLDALWEAAGTRCPALDRLRETCRVAVNEEFAGSEIRLRAGDEVALIPPVSGG